MGEQCARASISRMLWARCGLDGAGPESVVQTAPDTVTVRFFAHPQLAQSLWRAAALLPLEAEDAQGLAALKAARRARTA